MHPRFVFKKVSSLQVQRKLLLGLSSGLLLSTVILSFSIFQKKETVILLPPQLTKEIQIQGNSVSISYLEEMSLFLTHLLLDVTESSILVQGKVLLNYVSPEYYGTLKRKILEDQKRLQKDQLTLRFSPIAVKFLDEKDKAPNTHLWNGPLVLDIEGDLTSYVGGERVSTYRETYRWNFKMQDGKLWICGFQTIKSERPGGMNTGGMNTGGMSTGGINS